MAICPICSAESAGKRITFNGFDVYDLCIKCASYSVCLISPNVEVVVKENAIRWADREIQNNAEKIYLANCIRSWKQCAEDFISAHSPAPVVPAAPVTAPAEKPEVIDIDSTEIDLDATIKSFTSGNYSAVMFEQSKNTIDSSVLDMNKADFFAHDPVEEQPVKEETEAESVPETVAFRAPAPFSAPFSAPADSTDAPYAPTVSYEEAAAENIPDAEEASPVFEISFDEKTLPEEDTAAAEDTICEDVAEETGEDILFPEHIPMTDEEIDAAAKEFYEEAKKNFIDDGPDVKDYLREIASTLKSINEKMDRIEKEIAALKK